MGYDNGEQGGGSESYRPFYFRRHMNIVLLWICNIMFKPYRAFRIELSKKLELFENKLLYKYYKYEIIKKNRSMRRIE